MGQNTRFYTIEDVARELEVHRDTSGPVGPLRDYACSGWGRTRLPLREKVVIDAWRATGYRLEQH